MRLSRTYFVGGSWWVSSVFLPKFSSHNERRKIAAFKPQHRTPLAIVTMTDFFSRIFSIPSDDSSTYSSSAGVGSNAAEFWSGRAATTRKIKGSKNNKRREIVSLASSIGEESESLMARSKLISSSGSDDDDDSEGRDADRRALRPDGSGVSRSRGRHRRSSSSDHQPTILAPPPSKRPQSEIGVGIKNSRSLSNQRSLSKMRKASSSTRVQDDLNLDCHDPQSARSSSIQQNKQRSSSSSHRMRQQQQQQLTKRRSARSDVGGSQVNWLSRTFGGGAPKKHSPGSSSGGGNGGGTTHIGIKHMVSSPRRVRDTKLNLPSPGRSGGNDGLRQQPINVGDSIMIAQKYLEECEEMSALTVPKELMSVMSGLSETAERGARWRDDVQEVGRRNVLESSIVKAYHSNGLTRQSDDEDKEGSEIILRTTNTGISSMDGPAYPNIGEFASRFLETKVEEKEEEDKDDNSNNNNNNHIIYQVYSRDSNVHDKEGGGTSQAGSSKHQWPCDPSTDDYPMKVDGRMPPPPPLMPLPRRALPLDNIHNLSSQKRVSASFDDTPATLDDEVSFDEEKSRMDPPGTMGGKVIPIKSYPSIKIHAPDPPEDECHPSDEVSNLSTKKGGTLQSVTCQSIAGQSNLRSPSSKAVTFSLPPPTTMLQQAHATPPSPPFMSPTIDYYTLNQQSSTTTKPMTSWWSSDLLTPIAELWSSVESMPPINSTLMWDTKKESELLGEDYPLLVSEEWIDFHDEVVAAEEKDVVKAVPFVVDAADIVSSNRDVHSGFSHDEDTPDDEYIEDILNCSEEDDFECIIPAVTSSISSSNISDNVRHRSKWEVAYTPSRLGTILTEKLIQVEDDKWQSLIRERANAAITIQRCVRGMLERERYYLCLGSAIILQPFIRKFLSRKRYREYMRLKQSYYPKRWERINMKLST